MSPWRPGHAITKEPGKGGVPAAAPGKGGPSSSARGPPRKQAAQNRPRQVPGKGGGVPAAASIGSRRRRIGHGRCTQRTQNAPGRARYIFGDAADEWTFLFIGDHHLVVSGSDEVKEALRCPMYIQTKMMQVVLGGPLNRGLEITV